MFMMVFIYHIIPVFHQYKNWMLLFKILVFFILRMCRCVCPGPRIHYRLCQQTGQLESRPMRYTSGVFIKEHFIFLLQSLTLPHSATQFMYRRRILRTFHIAVDFYLVLYKGQGRGRGQREPSSPAGAKWIHIVPLANPYLPHRDKVNSLCPGRGGRGEGRRLSLPSPLPLPRPLSLCRRGEEGGQGEDLWKGTLPLPRPLYRTS